LAHRHAAEVASLRLTSSLINDAGARINVSSDAAASLFKEMPEQHAQHVE
jgi:hypothetical protein